MQCSLYYVELCPNIAEIDQCGKQNDPRQQDRGHADDKAPVPGFMAKQLHPGDGTYAAAEDR